MLAKAAGVSLRSVQRILEAHQLAPHRIRTFKLSTDPKFAEKFTDVVGLYIDPPAHAVVLSVDEKSQIQALDRTQPGLPMKPGRAGTMTHDYKRHGTTTLFAALNILDGTVIGRNMQRHRHQEFIRFLNTIEAQVPVGKVIHAVVDNYATHKHPKVRQWLVRHPRWTFHFTPTSASWLNAVEGFFAKLTRQRLQRGVFRSVVDLQLAINRFVSDTNADPKPFAWTADPKRVLAAVKRGKQTLESVQRPAGIRRTRAIIRPAPSWWRSYLEPLATRTPLNDHVQTRAASPRSAAPASTRSRPRAGTRRPSRSAIRTATGPRPCAPMP